VEVNDHGTSSSQWRLCWDIGEAVFLIIVCLVLIVRGRHNIMSVLQSIYNKSVNSFELLNVNTNLRCKMADISRKYFEPEIKGSLAGLSKFFASRSLNKTKQQVENELLKHPAYRQGESLKKGEKLSFICLIFSWLLI
jgi:hypothetical protein